MTLIEKKAIRKKAKFRPGSISALLQEANIFEGPHDLKKKRHLDLII